LFHAASDGSPCRFHAAAALDEVLLLAAVGVRVSSFNHDIASKLQGLMMSLDEISELLESREDPALRRATETAYTALREANALLASNRALTRTTTRTQAQLRELMASAGARVGVAVTGELPEVTVSATLPMLAHGISLALDAVAGPGRDRAVAVTAAADATGVTLSIGKKTPTPRNAAELLAVASYVLRRDGGSLACASDTELVLRLPS
jgi:hypothetical protein